MVSDDDLFQVPEGWQIEDWYRHLVQVADRTESFWRRLMKLGMAERIPDEVQQNIDGLRKRQLYFKRKLNGRAAHIVSPQIFDE